MKAVIILLFAASCARPAMMGRRVTSHVVFFGDSLTASVPDYGGVTQTYPYMAASQITDTSYSVYAYPGMGTDYLKQQVSEWLFKEYQPGARNVLVLWGGTNDCAIEQVNCTQAVIDNLTYIARVAHLAGWQVVAVTMLPRNNYFVDDTHRALFPAEREAINAAIKAGADFDAVADAAPELPDPNDRTRYWDECHLMPVGYQIVANHVVQAINALPERTRIETLTYQLKGVR